MKSGYQLRATILVCAATFSASALLVACGGGGGSVAAGASAATLTGTAAIGRPYPTGTVITVTDATNTQVATSTISSSDGSYSVVVPATAVAPLVISAVADGEETLYSVAPTLLTGTVNVTPLTNLIAARLSPTGDPAQLASQIQTTPTIASTTNVNARVAEVVTIISSVTGVSSDTTNPLTGVFSANGSGHDRVLDTVKVTVQPSGTSSNIQISVPNVVDSVTNQPVSMPLVAGGTTPTATVTTAPPALAAVTTAGSAALPVDGLSAKITALQARVAACYALPKASRTNWTGTGTGLPVNITASQCTGVFSGNDPATFKNNSYTIASNGAWKGIFTKDDLYTVTFDKGTYLYTIKNVGQPNNGDVVYLSNWKAADAAGVVVNQGADENTVRMGTGTDTALYLIGNQSNWDVSVEARVEYRDFTHADFSKFSYKNVGYNLYVKNTNDITSVVVTSPNGKTLTLKPASGLGYLGLTKSSGTVTGTSVVRMGAQFINSSAAIGQTWTPTGGTAVTVATPADIDPTLFWANPMWTDAEIAAISNQGTWKFDFTLTSGTTFTTYRRTINRAPTMAEAANVVWPALVSGFRTDLVTNSATNGGIGFSSNGVVDLSQMGNLAAWTVPAGAWFPTSAKVYGRDSLNSNTSFDDESTFGTSSRKTIVYCSDQDGSGTADQHCVGNQFKAGVGVGQFQFNGKDGRRIAHSLSINLRKN